MQEDFLNLDIRINDEIKSHLIKTANWGKVLAILSFIVLLGFSYFVIFKSTRSRGDYDNEGNIIGGVFTFLFFIVPIIKLYEYSYRIKKGIMENNQEGILKAFKVQSSAHIVMATLAILMAVICIGIIATS